jgi:hypothetical protein
MILDKVVEIPSSKSATLDVSNKKEYNQMIKALVISLVVPNSVFISMNLLSKLSRVPWYESDTQNVFSTVLI